MLNTLSLFVGNVLAAAAQGGGGNGNADGNGGVAPATISKQTIGGLEGNIQPNAQGLPGANVAVTITNGIMFFSLLFCLVGLVLSAGLWAVGAFSNNYTQSVNGKKGFLICAGAALAIGAAYFLVSWFFGAGSQVS